MSLAVKLVQRCSGKFFASVLLAALLCMLGASEVQAQFPRYGSRYESPYGSPFSPYFDYFRFDDAFLGNYNGIVRPNQVRRQTIQQHGSLLNQQGQLLNQQSSQIRGLEAELQQYRGESQMAPTGTGARYLDYSHFYSFGAGGSGRQ